MLDLGSEPPKEKLQLHEVLGHPEYLNNNSANATWLSESEVLYRDIDGTIFLYDITTDWKTVLASNFSLVSFISGTSSSFYLLRAFSGIFREAGCHLIERWVKGKVKKMQAKQQSRKWSRRE